MFWSQLPQLPEQENNNNGGRSPENQKPSVPDLGRESANEGEHGLREKKKGDGKPAGKHDTPHKRITLHLC